MTLQYIIGDRIRSGFVTLQSSTPDTTHSIFYTRKSRGSAGAPTNIVNGDYYGVNMGSGWSGATGWWDTASIRLLCDGVVTDNQRPPSAIEMWTNPANTAPALRWKLRTDGAWANSTAAIESTGAGAALNGVNCPAVDPTTPYTWVRMISSDGSTVYFPVWK